MCSLCIFFCVFVCLYPAIHVWTKSEIWHITHIIDFFFSKHLYTKQQQYLNHQRSFGKVLHVHLEHLRSTRTWKWDFWSYPVVSNMSTLNLFRFWFWLCCVMLWGGLPHEVLDQTCSCGSSIRLGFEGRQMPWSLCHVPKAIVNSFCSEVAHIVL